MEVHERKIQKFHFIAQFSFFERENYSHCSQFHYERENSLFSLNKIFTRQFRGNLE
jgi:hypothetical protein